MHRRRLGPGAPAVAAVGYGGMHLSIGGRPAEAQALRVIQAALDAGVTLIDTADVYCLDQHDIGHNERLIARGRAVAPAHGCCQVHPAAIEWRIRGARGAPRPTVAPMF